MNCQDHSFVSIIVCTRGIRPSLEACLTSVLAQACAHSEIIVVLNAPQNQSFATRMAQYPITLVNEPRTGVCIARNRGIRVAKGEILAFVDDDTEAHPGWLHGLLEGFADPNVACVTGRVLPKGLIAFTRERTERFYYGERTRTFWTLTPSDPDCYSKALGDPAGFGCNMAFRKSFLEGHTLFPADLGAGSLIGGGDEFYMFVQVLKRALQIYHNPSAVVTHVFEPGDAQQKRRMMQTYASAVALATKLYVEEKDLRWDVLRWLLAGFRRRLRRLISRRTIASEPQELLTSREKLRAYLRGPWVYWKSRQITRGTK